ncbi:MAG: hypothetical protein J7497_13480 [Chitinophagaceae bacterium]|nr:hypothetical protein [Chitinophagaceae bacterium]
MLPNPLIVSILHRYELNQPVTSEEKAVLHKWLINVLRTIKLSSEDIIRTVIFEPENTDVPVREYF